MTRRMTSLLLSAAACLAMGTGPAEPARAQASTVETRAINAALALFRDVARPDGFSGPCSLHAIWDTRSVARTTARAHLGIRVVADLVSIDQGTTPAAIIDPQNRSPGQDCNDHERQRAHDARLEAWRRDSSAGRQLQLRTIRYTFPVFNTDFSRAIIVVSHHAVIVTRSDDGAESRSSEGDGSAQIYVRRGGRWHFHAREDYFSYH